MSIITLVLILLALGVGLYLINVYVTAIDPKIKTLLNWVIVIVAILIVLYAFGLLPMRDVRVPQVR